MSKLSPEIERIATNIVDASIQIHRKLGPGLLESVYQQCLAYELRERGHEVRTEVVLPLVYRCRQISPGYRVDMLVDEMVLVENKSVESLLPLHHAQLLSYLRLSGCPLGFLLNWNTVLIKNGTHRLINL